MFYDLDFFYYYFAVILEGELTLKGLVIKTTFSIIVEVDFEWGLHFFSCVSALVENFVFNKVTSSTSEVRVKLEEIGHNFYYFFV